MNSKIIRVAVSAICLTLLINGSFAQRTTPSAPSTATTDRAALHQALLDLTNPWTVMCIAAHPDDEDGTSLIVMRRKYGAHTVSLFSTFGEGGQNAIGPELYEELGAIRARETMAAAEIQGSEPHFLGLKDFGYSKSADEAFRFWGHDEALRRMVLQIRKLRPDVIITNHSATSNDHGHHQATARLELEAFEAAADPKRFPEQLKDGVTIWLVQRLFVRAGRSNQSPAEDASVVTIDPNERDPVRGTVYAEEALRALQKHATQGPWPKTLADMARFRNSPDGKLPLIRYRLVREANGAAPLPKDSHNFPEGLRLPEKVALEIELPKVNNRQLVESMDNRRLVLEKLLEGYRGGFFAFTHDTPDPRLFLMRERLERAIAAAAGVTMTASPSSTVVTSGSKLNLAIKISNTGDKAIRTLSCGSDIPALRKPIDSMTLNRSVNLSWLINVTSIAPAATLNRSNQLQLPDKVPINVPLPAHLYDPSGLGLELSTSCSVEVADTHFNLEQTSRVDVAPAVEVTTVTPQTVVVSAQNRSPYFTLNITNHRNKQFRGHVIPRLIPPCKSIACSEATFEDNLSLGLIRRRGEPLSLAPKQSAKLRFSIPLMGLTKSGPRTARRLNGPYQLVFKIERATRTGPWEAIGESMPIVLSSAEAHVAPSLLVGYVRGFDHSLPNALAALGVASKELSVDEVKMAALQKYSAIIVDNRVYESQPELIAANQRLLDYAKDGGTLIVFYHKSNEWNPDERRKRPQLAPYKLVLGDERITDENAPITFIEPQHPLLNTPNKMGQEDFANWIQERGLYYPKDWDPQFHALLQSNDPGEQPLRGGLLVADYGRGHYIYSSMVWYRQLRAGVPGAYRMLANMISYGKTAP